MRQGDVNFYFLKNNQLVHLYLNSHVPKFNFCCIFQICLTVPRFKGFVLQTRNRQTHAQVVIPYESQNNNFIFIFLDLHVYKWSS
jgi:hypothetical protein